MKNMKKRLLALFLAFAMMVPSVSSTSWAAEVDSQTVETLQDANEAVAASITMGEKPENGETENEPFPAGTAGSQKFRIPCLVTLNDGTIVAGCDARWTTHQDGGGLDTIVSYSEDDGKTWHYTFANYLGDNGNTHNTNSSAFIDPSMATDGETIWMIADLYPAGIALNGANYSPATGHTGYTDDHNLALAAATDSITGSSSATDRASADFSYYLEKIDGAAEDAESYYALKSADGTTVEDYTIDAYFNIKGNNVDTNLFFGDSPYFPYPTDFLYLTSSADGGVTWSIPTLLDLKEESEQTLLVGPGRGLITSDGTMIFPCYEYTSGYERTCFIYSADGGKTWSRTADATNIRSSEAQVVELSNGTLRFFFRNSNNQVCYVDATGNATNGYTWSSPVTDTGVYSCSNTQMSAIKYSKLIDGKEAIIISYPASSSATGDSAWDRVNGRITIGLVQSDGSMDWKYTYEVNNGNFWYSCLTELEDHSIGLLYEYGESGAAITYASYQIEELAEDAMIGELWVEDAAGNSVNNVSMNPGDSETYTITGTITGTVMVASSDTSVATVTLNEAAVADDETTTNPTITVTANADLIGYDTATITVSDDASIVKFNVAVSSADTEKHEVVTLERGETATFRDTTGYYAEEETGVETSIAKVEMDGEKYATAQVAQLAVGTGTGNFTGNYIDISECLYTFTSTGTANQYTISSTTADGTDVYFSVYYSNQQPNVTAETVTNNSLDVSVTVAEGSAEDTFAFQCAASNDNQTKWVHFHKEQTGLYFNRCYDDSGSAQTKHQFEIYKPSTTTTGVIEGYEKLSSLNDIENGGQYLIVAYSDASSNDYTGDGYRYLLRPYSGGSSYNHVARLLKLTETVTVGSGITNSAAVFAGETKSIDECLYTFTSTGTDNQYTISAVNSDGATVYLNLQSTASDGGQRPHQATTSSINLTAGSTAGTFNFQDSVGKDGNGSYLHFLGGKYFDRCTNNTCGTSHEFELYKKSEGAVSAIPGYEQVTSLSDVAGDTQYLIVFKASSTERYVLNPPSGAAGTAFESVAAYEHVAKLVLGESGKVPSGTTDITITGVDRGQTTAVIGDTTYYITVTVDEKDLTLTVGDTYTVSGEVEEEATVSNIISTESTGELPEYEKVSSVKTGTYLVANFAKNGSVVTSGTASYNGWGGVDLEASIDWNDDKSEITTEYSSYELTIEAVDGTEDGYTIKNSNGLYLNFSSTGAVTETWGTKVPTSWSTTPQTFTIVSDNNGAFKIYVTLDGGVYGLNNFGADDSAAAGYGGTKSGGAVIGVSDLQSWYLYEKRIEGTIITAENVGETEILIGNVLYHVTVEPTVQEIIIPVGDTYIVEGTVIGEATTAGIVSTSTGALLPPYKEVTTVLSGEKYLIGNDYFVVTNTEQSGSDGGGSNWTAGLDMVNNSGSAIDYENTDYSAYAWTITIISTDSDTGIYTCTIQDANGNYLTFATESSNNQTVVSLGSVAQNLLLKLADDGYFRIYYQQGDSTYAYLNNFGGANNHASGWYNGDGAGNRMKLYLMADEGDTIITGESVGTTGITIGKVLYNVTVTDTVDYTLLEQWITIAEVLENDTSYTSDSRTKLSEVLDLAQAMAEAKDETVYSDADAFNAAQAEVTAMAEDLVEAIRNLQLVRKSITLTVGETRTLTVAGELTNYDDADRRIADVSVADGVLTVTGASTGIIDVKVGDMLTYIIVAPVADDFPILAGTGDGSGDVITKLTISADNTFDLNFKDGETVTWSTPAPTVDLDGDGDIDADDALLVIDENGTITFNQNLTTTASTTVTATTADGTTYTIPVIIYPPETATTKKLFDVYFEGINNMDVYYSWSCSTSLVHACKGEVIYVNFESTDAVCLDFFGAPYDGYALVSMLSTGGLGHYMTIHEGDRMTLDESTEGFLNYPNGAGQAQAEMLTPEQVMAMLAEAINRGADGALGFTRPSSDGNGVTTTLNFTSDRLPEVEKNVMGIMESSGLRADYRSYVEGMTASEGDFVYFEVNIKTYRPLVLETDGTSTIDYSNVILTDTALSYLDEAGIWRGASFIVDQGKDVVVEFDQIIPSEAVVTQGGGTEDAIAALINAETWADGEESKDHKYYVAYRITSDDLGNDLENIAELSYHYWATYSTGEFDATGADNAVITVSSWVAKDLVVDFGLPVTAEYKTFGKILIDNGEAATEAESAEYTFVQLEEGTANYGTVSIAEKYNSLNQQTGWYITYTPNGILPEKDTVTLTASNTDEEYTFNVYPASSVYYEETVLTVDDKASWSQNGTALPEGAEQEAAIPGATQSYANASNYGYDDVYAVRSESELVTNVLNAKATVDFTGTGIDLYANTTANTGIAMVMIKNDDGALKKVAMVDTVLNAGSVDGSSGLSAYAKTLNVPIVSYPEGTFDYDNYTATILHATKKVQQVVVDENGSVVTDDEGNPITETVILPTELRLDGVRIYGTLPEAEANEIYKQDKEASPMYFDLRDSVLAGMSAAKDSSDDYAAQLAASTMSQIYSTALNAKLDGTVIIDTASDTTIIHTGENLTDFLDNGSKNEVYLYPGQSIVVKLESAAKNPQIAFNALNGTASYAISSFVTGDSTTTVTGTETTLTSTTEMYYPLAMQTDTNGNQLDTTFVISNTSTVGDDGIKPVLAVSKLKLSTYDEVVTGVIGEITELDLTMALLILTDESGTLVEDENGVIRLAGDDRYETAYAVANEYKAQLGADEFDSVIVATGKTFADALSGSCLASAKNAPILLTNGKEENVAKLAAYIKENLAADGTVYILGGEVAVSISTEDAIKEVAANVKRLSGDTRYETNLAILNEAGVDGKELLVATGKEFADSLSASATKLPILLVKDEITEAQKALLENYDEIYIIGGTKAVSEEIQNSLAGYGTVERIAGDNRYATSAAIAERFFENADTAIVASAQSFPDGLCGGPLAAAMNAPLLLTADGKTGEAAAYGAAKDIKSGIVLGGELRISEESVKEIF